MKKFVTGTRNFWTIYLIMMKGVTALANLGVRRASVWRGIGKINSSAFGARISPSSPALYFSSSSSVSRNPTALFTWGTGSVGQLGHERFKLTKTDWGMGATEYVQALPRRVVPSKEIASISCGNTYSLGLTYGGHVLGWGQGFAGADSQSNTPVPLDISAGKY